MKCKTCNGSGRLYDHDYAGSYLVQCSDCHGTGIHQDKPKRFTYRDENGKAWATLKTDCTPEERMRFGRESLEKLARYEDLEEQGQIVINTIK